MSRNVDLCMCSPIRLLGTVLSQAKDQIYLYMPKAQYLTSQNRIFQTIHERPKLSFKKIECSIKPHSSRKSIVTSHSVTTTTTTPSHKQTHGINTVLRTDTHSKTNSHDSSETNPAVYRTHPYGLAACDEVSVFTCAWLTFRPAQCHWKHNSSLSYPLVSAESPRIQSEWHNIEFEDIWLN
jgi:hypothetical protein